SFLCSVFTSFSLYFSFLFNTTASTVFYTLSLHDALPIVSALGRGHMGITQYEDFIQTDAAINPGNSGGALINTAGELVGINTAIISQTGGYQGVGFAVPASMAKPVFESIVKTRKVVPG